MEFGLTRQRLQRMNAVLGNRRAALYQLKQTMESLANVFLGNTMFETVSTEPGADVVTLFSGRYEVTSKSWMNDFDFK